MVRWDISANGSYVIPFGYDASNYIPFTYQQTTGTSGIVSLGTYRSIPDNTPFPPTVTHVRDVNGVDNSAQTVDRFWYIDVPGSVTSSLNFTFVATEGSGIVSPRAQLWEPVTMGWWPPSGVQSNPTGNSTNASGITAFNNWWTLSAAASPLPVELIYFDAIVNNKSVDLNWKTATEINNDYFTLLKSKNGIDFEPIAVVDGAGTTTSPRSYSYTDEQPYNEISYYRLQQTDFDGKITLSEIKSVYLKPITVISFYPNPVTVGESLTITVQNSNNFNVELFDGTGKKVYSEFIYINSFSSHKIDINKLGLDHGMYFIKVYNDQYQSTDKIIFN